MAHLHDDFAFWQVIMKDHHAIGFGVQRNIETFPNFALVDIESGYHFDIFRQITPEIVVHNPKGIFCFAVVSVVFEALNQRGSAVSHTDNCYFDLTQEKSFPLL